MFVKARSGAQMLNASEHIIILPDSQDPVKEPTLNAHGNVN